MAYFLFIMNVFIFILLLVFIVTTLLVLLCSPYIPSKRCRCEYAKSGDMSYDLSNIGECISPLAFMYIVASYSPLVEYCQFVTETIFLSSYHRVSKKIAGSLSVGGNVS